MEIKIKFDRATASRYTNAPEDAEHVNKVSKLAANGAIPYVVREAMKDRGWNIMATSQDPEQIETAKLLIAYAWWARALEHGIPKSQFRSFINDQLAYLDARANNESNAGDIIEKWKQYG